MNLDDPCRVIPHLSISVGDEPMEPLGAEAWGDWLESLGFRAPTLRFVAQDLGGKQHLGSLCWPEGGVQIFITSHCGQEYKPNKKRR